MFSHVLSDGFAYVMLINLTFAGLLCSRDLHGLGQMLTRGRLRVLNCVPAAMPAKSCDQREQVRVHPAHVRAQDAGTSHDMRSPATTSPANTTARRGRQKAYAFALWAGASSLRTNSVRQQIDAFLKGLHLNLPRAQWHRPKNRAARPARDRAARAAVAV